MAVYRTSKRKIGGDCYEIREKKDLFGWHEVSRSVEPCPDQPVSPVTTKTAAPTTVRRGPLPRWVVPAAAGVVGIGLFLYWRQR